MKATKQYFYVVLFIMLYPAFESVDEIIKYDHSNESYRASLSCGVVCSAVQGDSNFCVCEWNPKVSPSKGYFSIIFTFLTWRVRGSKKLTYFNHHFRPSPTSLYSESVSFEHLKEIRTSRYKITNSQRSLAGMFSTSPHSQEQLFRKNVRKVRRLISKSAKLCIFCTFFTYMNTTCNFLTQRRSRSLRNCTWIHQNSPTFYKSTEMELIFVGHVFATVAVLNGNVKKQFTPICKKTTPQCGTECNSWYISLPSLHYYNGKFSYAKHMYCGERKHKTTNCWP